MKLEAGNWFLDYKNHRNIYSLACSPWKEIKTYFDTLKHLNFHTRLEHLEQMKKNQMDAYISNDGYNSSEKSGSRGKCGIL